MSSENQAANQGNVTPSSEPPLTSHERKLKGWTPDYFVETGFVFYLEKLGRGDGKIYYNELAERISSTTRHCSKKNPEFIEALQKAEDYATKVNGDPELAADLLLYSWATDVWKKPMKPVSQWVKGDPIEWHVDEEVGPYIKEGKPDQSRLIYYKILDKHNFARMLDLFITLDERSDKSALGVKVEFNNTEVFSTVGLPSSKKTEVLHFLERLITELNNAKTRTMKDANERINLFIQEHGFKW